MIVLATDPATHTLYVANGTNISGPSAGGNTLSVIDTRRCRASRVSSCQGPWPTITVGKLPSGIAIDKATGMLSQVAQTIAVGSPMCIKFFHAR